MGNFLSTKGVYRLERRRRRKIVIKEKKPFRMVLLHAKNDMNQ
ncbi:MAG: hypothetical protein ACJAQT_003665 [Akkermansiaceae bacterium]|jgi:hypothetical protein